jgi:hypothetical protein
MTVNWFVAQVNSVRATSMFFNKTYYIAVAEAGSATNNLVLEYDWQNNWRARNALTVATMGFFFNDPYYGDATTGQFVCWHTSSTNADGSNISLDVRTKAYDFGDNTRRKILRKVFASVRNTGAVWTLDYSTDGGATFKSLYDATGATTLTTTTDGSLNVHRFVPAAADLTGTKTVMIRARSSDANPAELNELHLDVIVREGEILV